MRSRSLLAVACMVLLACTWQVAARSGEDEKSPMDTLRSLEGTWVSEEPGNDGQPYTLVFKVTAAKSVVTEVMFPGSNHEMLNTYHKNGDDLIVTHYCAQGVQPRMKMVSNENGVMRFEFLDCTNLKEGEGCMGGLELSVADGKLTEKWFYLTDGKLSGPTVFTLVRKG